MFGKSATDLQSDIEIEETAITGTLNYVTGYTGFSGEVSEQSGNYLAIHCEADSLVDSITVELVGGTVGHPVTLDNDGLAVLRITNKDTQSIKIIATKGEVKEVKKYSLSGLTLNTATE